MFYSIVTLLGGLAVFVFGLKCISHGSESLIVGKKTESFSRLVKNPICGVLTGATVAGVTQSSVAVSFITVGLVEAGVIPFSFSAPIIMGANIGTTVTAQLISLSGGVGGIVGAFSSIIGLLLGFSKNNRLKTLGETSIGLGLLFAGLDIMDSSITGLLSYGWFTWLFTASNPLALFLNAMVLTSVIQSSSAVTGITVILANKGVVDFNSAVFLTLGSNVGSCFSVILASLDKSIEARKASCFNLCFNLLGAVLFFPFVLFCGDKITELFFTSGENIGRAIANFHTVFNLICAVVFLPFSKRLTNLISRIVTKEPKRAKYKVFYKTFKNKIRRFN